MVPSPHPLAQGLHLYCGCTTIHYWAHDGAGRGDGAREAAQLAAGAKKGAAGTVEYRREASLPAKEAGGG